jgi:AAHS family 4-hydroxybenzoate transporter-like MFS transporter
MSAAIQAGVLIDKAPWTLYQKGLTLLAALAIVIDGFDIQVLALAIPSLMKEWAVARSEFAPVLAAGLVGMALGGPIFGYWGDRWGRRPALIGAVTLFAIASLATVFCGSVAALAVLRFLTGFGAGGALPAAGALSAEFAPLSRRPVAVKLTIVCVPLGGMLAGFLAAQVLGSHGWRTLYLIGGIAPLVLATVLWRLLPESPRFLAQHKSGWPALERFLRRAGHTVPQGSVFAADAVAPTRAPIGELFTRMYLRDTMALWLAFFSCLGGIYLVFGWLPALLTSQGMPLARASSGLGIYNMGGVAGVFLWAGLTTWFGSRGPMVIGSAAAAASALAMLAIPGNDGALMAGIGLHGLLANAIQTSMYALAAHVYPTPIRATGVACAAAIGRIGGILSSLTGSAVIGAGQRAYWGSLAAAMIVAMTGLIMIERHIPPKGEHSK